MSRKDVKATALISFLMAFDSNLAPIVGQQITFTAESTPQVVERIDLFIQRAQITNPRSECDLVVKGILNGTPRGWLLSQASAGSGETIFQSDHLEEHHTFEELQQIASEPAQELTFTCVPPGSGIRIGIDRDADETAPGRRNSTL